MIENPGYQDIQIDHSEVTVHIISKSDTDFRAFVGGRIGAGKGDVDVRATIGSRGTTVSVGYNFYF